ncbi:MAG: hypothetical protein Q8L47_03635 [bacterium]|nr:hypothetical protein [bacterium]
MYKYFAQSAVSDGVGIEGGVSNLSAEDVINILNRAGTWMFNIFLTVAVIAILVAAFRYLTSGGKTENVSSATRALIYAVVAIALALLSASIPKLVSSLVIRS